MLMKLGLEWGLDKMMMMLVELSIHDFGKKKKILGDNDFEDVELLLDLWWVDSTSKRNWGDSSTLDYMSQNMAHWTAFKSC
jgi:hypothetical protein